MACNQVSNIVANDTGPDRSGMGVVNNSITMDTDAGNLAASDIGATDDDTSEYSNDSAGDSENGDYDEVYALENETYVIQKKLAYLKNFNFSNLYREDLGICCIPGEVCCSRCAYNFGFNRTLSDTKLIDRVALGLKPVGGIAAYIPNQNVRQKIINAGLEILVDGVKNRWGATMYYFSRTDIADLFFSDFVNLATLRDITGFDLPNIKIRNHTTNPDFYNELDNILARGIVYGYPIWSSIAIFFKENKSVTNGPVDPDDSDDADDSDGPLGPYDSEDDVNDCAAHAVSVETPIIQEKLNYLKIHIDQKSFIRPDLGICCSPGQLCCRRCAYNIRFRGGSPYYCLDDALLIKRVASGLKPVGEISVREPSEAVRSQIIDAGLELLVDGLKNKWGMVVYYFARSDIADKSFSDFVNLATLQDITGITLPDIQIRAHVINPAFYNESDSILARGICYGYPVWSSIALFFLNNFLLK